MIRLIFQREGAERRRDRFAMEHFHYTAIHQALQALINQAKKGTVLKHTKAKTIRLHSQQQRILLIYGDSDSLLGEDISVHHYITAI